MSEPRGRTGWDYNVGLVLAVIGAMILVAKFRIVAYFLKLWPLALIFLGWQMYKRAVDEEREHPLG